MRVIFGCFRGKTTTSNDLKTITTACRRMMRRVRGCGVMLLERVGRGWKVRTWFGHIPIPRERLVFEAVALETLLTRTPWAELDDAGLLERDQDGEYLRGTNPSSLIDEPPLLALRALREKYAARRSTDATRQQRYRNLQRIYAQEQQLNRDHPIWETPTHRCLRDGSLWKWEDGGWVRLIEPPSTTPHIPLTTHPTTIGSVSCPITTSTTTPTTTPHAH